ncbi:unnamed protein product, partial [Iphiclides podalirius]
MPATPVGFGTVVATIPNRTLKTTLCIGQTTQTLVLSVQLKNYKEDKALAAFAKNPGRKSGMATPGEYFESGLGAAGRMKYGAMSTALRRVTDTRPR